MADERQSSGAFPSEFRISSGSGRCSVSLNVLTTEDGLIVYLYGGERSHLGATVLSLPRASLSSDSANSCDSYVIPRPGHKDHIVAQGLAEQLCKALDTAVCVVAGIHIESAKPEEIATIMENSTSAGGKIISTLKER